MSEPSTRTTRSRAAAAAATTTEGTTASAANTSSAATSSTATSSTVTSSSATTSSKPTPEQQARIEANRLKAKQIYEAKQKERLAQSQSTPSSDSKKRHAPDNSDIPSEHKKDTLRPAKKFAKFVEYDLSKMTDTHGGFLSAPDDPLHGLDLSKKPANMSFEDYAERMRIEKEREERKARLQATNDKLNPNISANPEERRGQECYECKSPEIDWQFFTVFSCRVCKKCKDAKPEKYSLLTKTEAREDYLLTDSELKDEDLLPRLSKPNPHKSTYSHMQLFLRYQVEAFAVKKWGTLEAMDQEYERRKAAYEDRKQKKFTKDLTNLRLKTRVDLWKKGKNKGWDESMRHTHVWDEVGPAGGGMTEFKCATCGMEKQELVF